MNIKEDNFINVYSGVYPENFCQHLVNEFERHISLGSGSNRMQSENAAKHQKDDYQLFYNGKNFNIEPFEDIRSEDLFFDGLQKCFDHYTSSYSILKDFNINCNHMKFQKTTEGGGYHVWHCEQANGKDASRVLVYMLYLNTLPEESNGETEFLYQKKRLTPTENTIVLWPAGFTHPHRGNPVYGSTAKYIVTGWFFLE